MGFRALEHPVANRLDLRRRVRIVQEVVELVTIDAQVVEQAGAEQRDLPHVLRREIA